MSIVQPGSPIRPAREPILSEDARAQRLARLEAMYRPYFGRIAAGEQHLRQMAIDNLDEARSHAQLDHFEQTIARPLAGLRLLEVGSGVGLTVAAARKRGIEAFGIEPGGDEFEGTLQVSWDVLREGGIHSEVIRGANGEQIPFPDNHFDLVFSSNVLEHVDDPPQVVAEIVRVLKPGGHAQIVVPNYGSLWEGHYGIIWIPHLSPALAKLYVRLRGRDAAFIDTLQFVTRGKLERWLAPHRDRIDVLGWGVDVWEQRIRTLDFAEYSALGRLKGILRLLHRVKVIPGLIAIGKALHWETPIVLTFRKREVP
jgi:SAM-dependent methyltransferase